MDGRPLPVLLDRGAAPAQEDALRPDALARGVEQHLLQVAAVDRELRMRVAGMAAERLGDRSSWPKRLKNVASFVVTATLASAASSPSAASSFVACGRRLMPTPTGRISGAAS